jgi:probable HAF family extracellular repeat protein
MVGLGDLAGGGFLSKAAAVSADGSVVVGHGTSASGQEAFRWTSSGGMVNLGDLAGGLLQGWATGVSADGSAVVGQGSSASGSEAFLWTLSGGMIGLGDLPGGSFSSWANSASANGSVVVGQGNSASGNEAFYWTATGGMQSLKNVLTNSGLNLTGWTLGNATGISADGLTIVGNGINPFNSPEAWIATIPEPCTLLLLGLGGLVLQRKR